VRWVTVKALDIVYFEVYCIRQLPVAVLFTLHIGPTTSATYSPGRLAVKTSEKQLVPFVVLIAVTWVLLRLGMEVFAK
jgi:hypothetical protein